MTNTTASFNYSLYEDSTTMYILTYSVWAWIKKNGNKNNAGIEYNHQCVYSLIMMYNWSIWVLHKYPPAIDDDD